MSATTLRSGLTSVDLSKSQMMQVSAW